MSDPGSSPEVEEVEEVEEEEEVEEVEDEYEGNEEERFNVGEEEPEDVIDEELEGEGDVEEDENLEGLDLDMADEDGDAYQDQDEIDGMGYQNELQEHDESATELHGDVDLDVDARVPPDSAVAEVCNGDEGDMRENNIAKDTVSLQREEAGAPPATEAPQTEKKAEESKDDPLSRPEHGSEVFVGNISKDTVEEDLRDLCSSCGDIFEVRVMRDKDKGDNANKGFAFVTFTNKEYAQRAIETLNDSELKGRKLRFSSSQLKNKLFIGNIPKGWDKDELEKTLLEKGPGIQNIELVKDPHNSERNRGFAFVEYYNHACAEHSRRILSASGFKLGTNTPTINWADSPSSSDHTASSQVKVVYVRNLPESTTQEQLWKLFEHHGEITKVMLPQSKPGQQKRDFGFIHFTDRSSALKAIEKSEKYVLDGRELETSLAKPPAEKGRPGAVALPSPFGSGILPQTLPARASFGLPGPNMYGGMAVGFGASRGFGQVQPVIYGRGPTPAGMAMVPMMLPDGRIGYVLQQAGTAVAPAVSAYNRDGRGGGRGPQPQKQGGGSNSRRYQPY